MTDSNGDPNESGTTLRDIMSTYQKEMEITQAVLDQAEADAPKSGYETRQFYTLQVDNAGKTELVTVDASTVTASTQTQATDDQGNPLFNEIGEPIYVEPTASSVFQTVENSGYPGYLVGDGFPSNGAPFSSGITFPVAPVTGQFCLRTDYLPKRLFRFDGSRWVKVEDDVRMTMSNNDVRNTYKTGFINNTKPTNINKRLTDVFYCKTSNTFRTTDPLQSFVLATGYAVTKTDYDANYGVEVFVNDVPVEVTTSNKNGKLAFTIQTKLKVNDKVEWVLYGEHIDQRQSLSKVLKPKADL